MQTAMTAQELMDLLNSVDTYYYQEKYNQKEPEQINKIILEHKQLYENIARKFLNSNGYLIPHNKKVEVFPKENSVDIVLSNGSGCSSCKLNYDFYNEKRFIIKSNEQIKIIEENPNNAFDEQKDITGCL